ncbi:MAG: hypothetical protein KKE20_00940 [Nanoarchaeota archaeon]|nr:hypothetical protein [Nanoarchaeota archaeon]
MKFWLSKKERMDKWKEARRGWGTTKGMTPLQYVAWRDTRMHEKKKKEMEFKRKKDEEARKRYASQKNIEAGRAKSIAGVGEPKKHGSRLKLLIVVVVIVAIIYLYFRYLR